MKKLVKSTLLALGIFPLLLLSDDLLADDNQHYQVKSRVIFHSPHTKVGINKDPFEPFGAEQLGTTLDINLDFYFYNITSDDDVKSLATTDGISTTEFYKIVTQPATVPLKPGYHVNVKTKAKPASNAKVPSVKTVATASQPTPVVTLPRPMTVQQPTIEPTKPDAVYTNSRVIFQFEQGTYTGGIGDAMVPFYGTPDNFFYANLIGSGFGPVYQTYSAGLGHRQVINNAIYGFYGFYDKQKSQGGFYYDRVSGGVERLGMTWDVRVNFYFYPNTPNNIKDLGQQSAFIKANTNDIYYRHDYDVKDISSGADIEVGRTLGFDNLRGYVAAYSFGQHVNGGRARITYNINPHWQINGMGQYDGGRGWLAMGGISYTLGRMEVTNTIIDRIHEAVVRDLTAPEVTIDHYQKTDLDTRKIYFASPEGNSIAGTQNDPMSLDTAIATAKPGDFIYLQGGQYDMTQPINLKTNQIFWGTGADLYTQGAKKSGGFLLLPSSSSTSTLNADTITSPDCGVYYCAIYVTATTHYGGFDLTSASTSSITNNVAGILIGNAQDTTFNYVNVSGFTTEDSTGYGIRIDDGGTGTANPIFTDITSNHNNIGLSIVSSGDITINGDTNAFNNNLGTGTSNGVGLSANASTPMNITIKNAEFNGNATGIYLNNTDSIMNVDVHNIDASNNVYLGMWISQNANVTGSYATISNNGPTNHFNAYGIYMDETGTLTGHAFTLVNNGSFQVLLYDTSNIATLYNSSIIGLTEQGTLFVSNGELHIINPVNLIGVVTNQTFGGLKAILNIRVRGVALVPENEYGTWTCNVVNGKGGPCSS